MPLVLTCPWPDLSPTATRSHQAGWESSCHQLKVLSLWETKEGLRGDRGRSAVPTCVSVLRVPQAASL